MSVDTIGETAVGPAWNNGSNNNRRAMVELARDIVESETMTEQRQRWFWDWFGWGSNEATTSVSSTEKQDYTN